MDLLEFFEARVAPLPLPSGSDIAALMIPETVGHRIGKDARGCPCLLLQQAPGSQALMPVRLANLTVTFNTVCSVVTGTDERIRDTFTILQCGSGPSLWSLFLTSVAALAPSLGPLPTTESIRRAVLGLVDLFQALSAPPQKTVQGIWGELFLVVMASDPVMVAAAWHADPTTRFDFSRDRHRIEVKSSGRRERRHHFSLEQLTPPAATEAVIASLFVERAGGGTTLGELFDTLRARLEHDARLWASFSMSFYRSLGSSWVEALGESFDRELAHESLAFFSAALVPKPHVPLPGGVSEVRFLSDLSSMQRVPLADLRAYGGLLAAAAPRESRT